MHLPLPLNTPIKAKPMTDIERNMNLFLKTVKRLTYQFRNSPEQVALINSILQEFMISLDKIKTSRLPDL